MNPIMLVAGTRPEVIKISPILEWLQDFKIETVLVWSGQHYDYELSEVFFKQLDLPKPDVNLNIGSGSHAKQTEKVMSSLEKVIAQYHPSIAVAQGDTNTVAAVAITATKLHVPFAHVEAGLRSYDRRMPEEINRIVADSIAELLFAPTELAFMNLTHEGIPVKRIHLTGNTVVDVLIKHKEMAHRRGEEILKELKLSSGDYLLVTFHREENTDNPSRLSNIIEAVSQLSQKHKIVLPLHPRTKNKLQLTGVYKTLEKNQNIKLIPPQGYLEFLGLLNHCLVVLTDSGGVQEEALTLGIPTVTLRYNTERPETVLYGINVLAGTETKSICKLTEKQINNNTQLRKIVKMNQNPFGTGNAGKKIAQALQNAVDRGIEIETSDTRTDPYITYALLNSNQLDNLKGSGNNYQILALFNQSGLSQTPNEPNSYEIFNGKILVRAPLTTLKKVITKQ